ncbi:MAG: hypothetical protein FIB07_13180 [Candidatus Methanoperedens sp.]|nr:hypothetical protein [Candidatus Methanoperedens sp.]
MGQGAENPPAFKQEMNWPLEIVKLIPNNNCRDCIFRAHSQKNFKPFFTANRNSNKRSGLPALSSLHESRPFRPQFCDLIASVKISPESLQHGEYIINLPGYAPAAAVLIAELHGRMGHFLTVIRLKKVDGSLPPVFDVEEIMNLQAIRDKARTCR